MTRNIDLENAIRKASNVIELDGRSKYFGLKHLSSIGGCDKRNTTSLGDGEFLCNPCQKKFTFNEWYLQVTNGPKAISTS
jgi:hypothetical protein